jgi:hypothetical protein
VFALALGDFYQTFGGIVVKYGTLHPRIFQILGLGRTVVKNKGAFLQRDGTDPILLKSSLPLLLFLKKALILIGASKGVRENSISLDV